MENKIQIMIREAVTDSDTAAFWEQLYAYFKRDIFPEPEDPDREYFLGGEYREQIQRIHDRAENRCSWLFFSRDGQDIGLAMPVIFPAEDGKCFLMEFCVFPEFRGGTGRQCAAALLDWAKENGARYAELNCGNARRSRFWESVGFRKNGADEWGEPLMLLPPEDEVPVTVRRLTEPEDWQLKKLENGFLTEVGEEALTEEKQKRLAEAIRAEKISFFLAMRGTRAVGMCSVARCFSTFSCGDIGVFEDFFIEPVFRRKGIARKLAQAAQAWCRENGMASLTVSCALCDEGMYRALGFALPLGQSFACLPQEQ